jgi:hypothetical protein
VDGVHVQELNVSNPDFPVGGTAGVVPSANRYFLDPALQSPRNTRVSAGVEQGLYSSPSWVVRANALYAYTRTERTWRGLNLNPPVNSVRPDPAFANVVEVVSDASARQQQLTLGWNVGLPPQPPGNDIPKVFDWKRFALYGSYILTSAHNNTDGDFAVSPTATINGLSPAISLIRSRSAAARFRSLASRRQASPGVRCRASARIATRSATD